MYVRAVQLTSHSQLLQNCASLWICQGFAYTIEFFGCQFHYVNSRRSACVLAFRYLSIHQQDTSTANPRERIDVYQYIYIPTAAKHSAEKKWKRVWAESSKSTMETLTQRLSDQPFQSS